MTKEKNIEIVMMPLADIVADKEQPRQYFDVDTMKVLKDSVIRYGIMNPLRVEKLGDKFLLEDGERRFRVATELKLKEVPVIILPETAGVDRLIKQFHIQEQHEGWTPTEKAMAIYRISSGLKISVEELCRILGLASSTARDYLAFATLANKNNFTRNEIGLKWATQIVNLKNFIKRLHADNDLPSPENLESALEQAIVSRIKAGELEKSGGLKSIARVKDSFTKDIKLVKKFLETDISVEEMFISSKARGAYYLRNGYVSAGYCGSNIKTFLKNPDVKLSPAQVQKFKDTIKTIKELLDKAGVDY